MFNVQSTICTGSGPCQQITPVQSTIWFCSWPWCVKVARRRRGALPKFILSPPTTSNFLRYYSAQLKLTT